VVLTYVDEVRPTAVLTASWLGRTVPLHATSTGKALLAFLPAAEVSRVLAEELPAFTDATITTPEALAAELAATRARGYGTCAGELESSLYGVSAPVLDRSGRPLAVLSIWGPGNGCRNRRSRSWGPSRAGRPAGRGAPDERGDNWPDEPQVVA
jgi:DNA-binding IclR family transcriptional regulator